MHKQSSLKCTVVNAQSQHSLSHFASFTSKLALHVMLCFPFSPPAGLHAIPVQFLSMLVHLRSVVSDSFTVAPFRLCDCSSSRLLVPVWCLTWNICPLSHYAKLQFELKHMAFKPLQKSRLLVSASWWLHAVATWRSWEILKAKHHLVVYIAAWVAPSCSVFCCPSVLVYHRRIPAACCAYDKHSVRRQWSSCVSARSFRSRLQQLQHTQHLQTVQLLYNYTKVQPELLLQHYTITEKSNTQ